VIALAHEIRQVRDVLRAAEPTTGVRVYPSVPAAIADLGNGRDG
jgi:hypothetical protein